MYDDCISIGSTPPGEDCAQLGSDDYKRRALKECKAYINQLRRHFGEEPDGAALYVKSNIHDFGTYYEVACRYESRNTKAREYALKCESEGPEYWDDAARAEMDRDTELAKYRIRW